MPASYRCIMATGTVVAKLAIARAEQLAGRAVNKQALANGHAHSHDGGRSFHHGITGIKASWSKRTTWTELERQGVKRCCVMFSDGRRCRRRASEPFGSSWCDKHGPEMKMHTDWANAILRRRQMNARGSMKFYEINADDISENGTAYYETLAEAKQEGGARGRPRQHQRYCCRSRRGQCVAKWDYQAGIRSRLVPVPRNCLHRKSQRKMMFDDDKYFLRS